MPLHWGILIEKSANTQKARCHEKKNISSSTTTTGKCRDGMPPGGKLKSLLGKLDDFSGQPPFAR